MALPVRSDGQQYYQNLSGYTGEATPESVDIMGANFQKQTEATKAGLAYDRAEKKQAQKSAWQKTSNGAASKPTGTPKFRSAWEAYNYHKQNGVK